MTEALGLRARKKLERRQRIEDAAIALISANGFDATTVDDIAGHADIAPRTFFYYFPTKEDVVLADYADRLRRITEVLEQRNASESSWAALRAAFVTVADDYETRREDLIARFTVMARTPSVYARSLQLQAGWEDDLTQILSDRTPDSTDSIEPRLLASAALACMRSSLRHWILTEQREPLPQLIQGCFDRLGNGLTAHHDPI